MVESFTPIQKFKMAYSTVAMIFSVSIIMSLIFNGDTKVSREVNSWAAFVLIWAAIIWLTMVEGGQASLVGLPPVDMDLYKDTHPISWKCTSVTNKGDNLDRYLMGRQFMVVFIVFTINMSGGPLSDAGRVFGMPDWVQKVMLGEGLAMILTTANIGQLTSQVNASHCMLDFINTYFAVFTLYVAMAIEATGLLHTCYLIQMTVANMAGKPIESSEAPRTGVQNAFFWGRVLLSLVCLAYAIAVTVEALFAGKTTMWESVPSWASIILFLAFMCIIGMLEGMQIAFFAVAKLPRSERGKHEWCMKTCHLLFKGEGKNLPGFMIGRQLCVVSCFFFAARVTSLNVDTSLDDSENVFGVSDAVQQFFNFGFLGAYVTTIIGSISWQLVASAFPIAFMMNPLVFILLNICLFLEATGICAAAWFLAAIQKKVMGYQLDEVYVGTPEERAKTAQADKDENQKIQPGRMRIPTYAAGSHTLSPQVSQEEE